jgi:hypothetical protein
LPAETGRKGGIEWLENNNETTETMVVQRNLAGLQRRQSRLHYGLRFCRVSRSLRDRETLSLHNSEIDQIEASIKSFVQRAYDLGRIDTLRKVVQELNALDPSVSFSVDGPPAEIDGAAEAGTVAMTETAPVAEAEPVAEAAPAPEPVFKPLSRPARPWWARLGR